MRETPTSYHCKIASCRAARWGVDWAPSPRPSGSKDPSRNSESHPQHRSPLPPPAVARVAPATSRPSTSWPSDSAASRPTPCIRVTAHPHPARQHRTCWKAGKWSGEGSDGGGCRWKEDRTGEDRYSTTLKQRTQETKLNNPSWCEIHPSSTTLFYIRFCVVGTTPIRGRNGVAIST